MSKNIPEWIQASGFLVLLFVSAVSVSSITLYRLDSLEEKVDSLIGSLTQVTIIQKDIENLKIHNNEITRIFEKFSASVDSLSIVVAQMQVRLEVERENHGKER